MGFSIAPVGLPGPIGHVDVGLRWCWLSVQIDVPRPPYSGSSGGSRGRVSRAPSPPPAYSESSSLSDSGRSCSVSVASVVSASSSLSAAFVTPSWFPLHRPTFIPHTRGKWMPHSLPPCGARLQATAAGSVRMRLLGPAARSFSTPGRSWSSSQPAYPSVRSAVRVCGHAHCGHLHWPHTQLGHTLDPSRVREHRM